MSCVHVALPFSALHAPDTTHFNRAFTTPRHMEVSGSEGSTILGASSSSSSLSLEKRDIGEAEYLNSRCVLFTYYQGDIGSVVDEHFSRALGTDHEGKHRTGQPSTASSPSSRRSFPPSFWDSNYPSPPSRPHCDPASYPMDSYAPVLPHSHPSDSWGFGAGQAFVPPRPHHLHELYHPPPGLESHYSPLLMTPLPPPHPLPPGHYELGKLEHAPTWPALLPPTGGDVALALNVDPGLQPHKKAKELYWF